MREPSDSLWRSPSTRIGWGANPRIWRELSIRYSEGEREREKGRESREGRRGKISRDGESKIVQLFQGRERLVEFAGWREVRTFGMVFAKFLRFLRELPSEKNLTIYMYFARAKFHLAEFWERIVLIINTKVILELEGTSRSWSCTSRYLDLTYLRAWVCVCQWRNCRDGSARGAGAGRVFALALTGRRGHSLGCQELDCTDPEVLFPYFCALLFAYM